MNPIFKISPAFPNNYIAPLPQTDIPRSYLMTDTSLEVLKFANCVHEFLIGAKDYWSGKGLMEGYVEGTNLAVEHLLDSFNDANPVTQAFLGSTAGVVNLMGAIPFGLGHWIHESARDLLEKDLGTGVKTFISMPLEGFRDGAKFLWHQVDNWFHGQISPSTFGVGYEVSTTLGTGVLMFLGIKGIHRGGSNMIQGFKNLEISQPPLATNIGVLSPLTLAGETVGDLKPMGEGLIFNTANKKEKDSKSGNQGNLSQEKPSEFTGPRSPLDMLVSEEKLPTDNPYITVKSRKELDGFGFRISTKTKEFLLELENSPSNSKLALRFEVGELLKGNGKYLRNKHLEGLLELVRSVQNKNDLLRYWEQVNYHVVILAYAADHFPRSMGYALKDFNLVPLQKAADGFPQITELLLKIENLKVTKPNGQ